MDLQKNIERLLDMESIKNLRIRYTHALDSMHISEAITVFSADAFCQTDRDPWIGRNAIRQGLEKAFKDYDVENYGSYPFMHIVSNHLIEFKNDYQATGKCYLVDTVTQREKDEFPLLLLGVYIDEYEKINGQWLIIKSHLNVNWPERNY
ncbi:nuclear transport factor 2 family protein [Rhizosphaericola mali]|uniref:Nuclear transport factor 2 family protein n=1 Tax=Rhizosphaericola mali TaxID=2545455 RepID=A0A5P2G2L0_9BACT|nr:nuclear transport factor 2 family protein [Rhizosphaericola mali]QES88339.1 nuclear transport factor 2 family protein [Rhizosphaericola mali]